MEINMKTSCPVWPVLVVEDVPEDDHQLGQGGHVEEEGDQQQPQHQGRRLQGGGHSQLLVRDISQLDIVPADRWPTSYISDGGLSGADRQETGDMITLDSNESNPVPVITDWTMSKWQLLNIYGNQLHFWESWEKSNTPIDWPFQLIFLLLYLRLKPGQLWPLLSQLCDQGAQTSPEPESQLLQRRLHIFVLSCWSYWASFCWSCSMVLTSSPLALVSSAMSASTWCLLSSSSLALLSASALLSSAEVTAASSSSRTSLCSLMLSTIASPGNNMIVHCSESKQNDYSLLWEQNLWLFTALSANKMIFHCSESKQNDSSLLWEET